MPITTHETPGPLDLDIRVQAGRVDIETADTAETTVEIEAAERRRRRPGSRRERPPGAALRRRRATGS